jgi:hypothetical protein
MDYRAIAQIRCGIEKEECERADERDLEKFVAKVKGQFSEEEIGGDNHD